MTLLKPQGTVGCVELKKAFKIFHPILMMTSRVTAELKSTFKMEVIKLRNALYILWNLSAQGRVGDERSVKATSGLISIIPLVSQKVVVWPYDNHKTFRSRLS